MKVVVVFALWVCVASGVPATDLRHVETFLAISKQHLPKKYRPLYHITTPYGWVNDPAGFVYFKRKFHVFYQFHPYNGSWGPINWGHIVSKNLVDWAHYPPALIPREYYDRQGCFAGSVVTHNGYLAAFYTGHMAHGNHSLNSLNVAVSADGVLFQKYLYNPVLRNFPDRAELRNSKVWRYRKNWYMLATFTINNRGHLMIYSSPDLYSWIRNSTVAYSYGDMGHTWESPDMFQLGGVNVILLSVQGIKPDGFRFKNAYQCGYVIGRLNYHKMVFEDLEISTSTFNELDYGHDFYAAKTCKSPDGRRLLIAWLGVWENDFFEAKDGWAGMLTLMREVRFNDKGRLLTPPAREIAELRSDTLEDAWYGPGEGFHAEAKSFELVINCTSAAYDAIIIFEWGYKVQYTVSYWADRGRITVDRGGEDGLRQADWGPTENLYLRIFVDRSSIEVFCGEGEVVFSSRIYPKKTMVVKIAGEAQLHIRQYRLRRSIGYDKKLIDYIEENLIAK